MKLRERLVETNLQFPVIGHNGYGGEQDGNNAVFVGTVCIEGGRNDAPDVDVPDWLETHWCRHRYILGCGHMWELSLAYWPEKRDGNIPSELAQLIQ